MVDIETYFQKLKRYKHQELDELRTTFVDQLTKQNGAVSERLRKAALRNFDIMRKEVEEKYAVAYRKFEGVTRQNIPTYTQRVIVHRSAKHELESSLRVHKRVLYDYMMEFMK